MENNKRSDRENRVTKNEKDIIICISDCLKKEKCRIKVNRMQRTGIGDEYSRRIIEEDGYVVDKTMPVQDLIENVGRAALFTRPGRFGKTLALSVLRTFFELEYDFDGNVAYGVSFWKRPV